MSPCSSRIGFAAPMSSPRYTNAESTLTISPPYRAAQARAKAVLPDAVGPAIASARGRASAPAVPARRSVPMLRQRRVHLLVRLAHRTHRHAVEQAGDHDRARCREEPGHHFVQLAAVDIDRDLLPQ